MVALIAVAIITTVTTLGGSLDALLGCQRLHRGRRA